MGSAYCRPLRLLLPSLWVWVPAELEAMLGTALESKRQLIYATWTPPPPPPSFTSFCSLKSTPDSQRHRFTQESVEWCYSQINRPMK